MEIALELMLSFNFSFILFKRFKKEAEHRENHPNISLPPISVLDWKRRKKLGYLIKSI